MFKDIQRGFSFSLGRILFRLFLFIVIGFIVLLIGSCKAHAFSTNQQPNQIYADINPSHTTEYFNVVCGSASCFPRDANNEVPYFNYSMDQMPAFNHTYATYGVDFYYNSGENTDKTIYYSVLLDMYYFNGYDLYWQLVNNNTDLLNEYIGYSGNQTPATVINGQVKYHTTDYLGYEYLGSGIFKFKYKFNTRAFSSVYIPVRPWTYGNNKSLAIGVHIDNVVNWAGGSEISDLQDSIDTLNRDWINNNNTNTQNIITNNNTNSRNIITAITNLPSTIINGISTLFTNLTTAISNLFTILWTNISGAFSSLFGYFDDILSNDEPTSQYISNYIQSFPLFDSNIVAQFVTLPIHILGSLTGTTCIPISLGSLFGTNLTIPCLGSVIYGILGTIYSIISWMITFFIYYKLIQNIKDTFMSMLVLEANVSKKFKIGL